MMRRIIYCLSLLLGLCGPVGTGWAQTAWRDLPPEERRQLRQQMREHWQQTPPAEREWHREGGTRRWADLPPEDRRRIREEMREHGNWRREREEGNWQQTRETPDGRRE